MRDDQLDEMLSRRLGAYEGRVPDADLPGPSDRPRSRGIGWAVLTGGGAAVIAAGTLAYIVISGALSGPVGTAATPSPSASAASSFPEISTSPSPSGTSEPSTPPALSSGSPAPITGLPGPWTVAAQFVDPTRRYLVADLVEWSDGLIAVGARWSTLHRNVFGPPPELSGMVWRSSDGVTWTDESPVRPGDGSERFAQVDLRHAFVTLDGSLVVAGESWTDPAAEPTGYA